MFEKIEIPIFIPFMGSIIFCIFIIIFGYFLFNINKILKEIKKGSYKSIQQNNKINTEIVDKKQNIIPDENYIISPMVGMVYLKPEESKPEYVKIDDHIKQGDTIALIEAMKTFNAVNAPRSGIIKEILISNAQPVEYGEKLFVIE